MARRFLRPDTTPQASDSGASSDAAPPAPHVQWNLHGSALKIAVAGNVVFAVLFFAAVIWRIFFTGTTAAQEAGAAVSPAPQPPQEMAASPSAASTPRSGGLGKADLLALPVYVHGSSSEEGGGAEGRVECAVCLSELRDGETGRVLPLCGHQFHAACVDRWFRLHVTCPLCRAVVASGGSGKSYPKVQLGV